MRRIGILGGSFNPIHNGHIHIAKEAKEYLKLDEVMLVPNQLSPFKQETQVPFEDRFAMVKLAIEGVSGFSVSDIEKSMPTPSYTIATIKALHENGSITQDDQVYFLIGDDQAEMLDQWKDIGHLSQLVTFGIFRREREPFAVNYPHVWIPASLHDASSTKIRQGDFTNLDPKVRSYILDHELYIQDIVKQRLPEKRYLHTLSVRETAMKIGSMHGLDLHKLSLAAYLHDIAKYLPKEEMAYYMARENEKARALPYPIHHQFASYYIAKEQLGITDEDVLEAIRNHTTGGYNPYVMTLFIADKIEPLRNYDVSEEWAMLEKDLKEAYELVKQKQKEFIEKENIKR